MHLTGGSNKRYGKSGKYKPSGRSKYASRWQFGDKRTRKYARDT
jgi:hypothetical protein